MFLKFFYQLKNEKLPVSLQEFLTLLDGVKLGLCDSKVESFYFLARSCLVKDEKKIDRFDRVFSNCFSGIDDISNEMFLNKHQIAADWLKKLTEKLLTPEEMKKIESLGGFEKLMETLKKRLEEQKKRHQGGSKWIGTAGTSPFGAYGYNPEGVRIGQQEGRNQKAVKVWDRREFKDFDDQFELGTRGMKIALKRLRRWAREGTHEELDLTGTIAATARSGFLDIKTQKEKFNAIKVLIFFDVGGSMDSYVKEVQELFSATTSAFKHLKYYYFHNCLYEGVWTENVRRWTDQTPTQEVLRTYGNEYKCIFVGDASMSPYEIEIPGGANEHYNPEAGRVWLERALIQWPKSIWINPIPDSHWQYSQSTQIIKSIFSNRMVPLSLRGLDSGMKMLS